MSKTSCKSFHQEAGTSQCLTFCFKDDELMTTKAFCLEYRAQKEARGCHKEKALHPAAFLYEAENIWTFQAGSEVTAASFKANNYMLCKTRLAVLVPKKTQQLVLVVSVHPELHHDRERLKITINKMFLFHFVSQHKSTNWNDAISGNSCVSRVWKRSSECSIHTNITFFSHLTTSAFHHSPYPVSMFLHTPWKHTCACLYHVWVSAICFHAQAWMSLHYSIISWWCHPVSFVA